MHVIYTVLLQTAKVRSFYGGSGHISLGDCAVMERYFLHPKHISVCLRSQQKSYLDLLSLFV